MKYVEVAGQVANKDDDAVMMMGLISDTHGVYDEDLEQVLANQDMIIHAGDVGHHGGHQAVLHRLQKHAPVYAVCGNVDDTPDCTLPEELLLSVNGWRVLVTHIVGMPPRTCKTAAARIREAAPDIVIFGHSHKPGHIEHEGVWYINPGSAGPARFKLPRTAAVLTLPPRSSTHQDREPEFAFVSLRPHAPPRLTRIQPG